MDGTGRIYGITVLDGELFVLRGKTWRGVDVYDSKTFAFKRILQIPVSKKLNMIVASNGIIFISFWKDKRLLLYDCLKATYLYVALKGTTTVLSRTKNGNLLITMHDYI